MNANRQPAQMGVGIPAPCADGRYWGSRPWGEYTQMAIDLGTDPMAAVRKRTGEQTFQTEDYVSSPPALWIVDERNDCFTLGFRPGGRAGPRGEFSFDVLFNGVATGVIASRIERRAGRVRCFTRTGWKIWNGSSFT